MLLVYDNLGNKWGKPDHSNTAYLWAIKVRLHPVVTISTKVKTTLVLQGSIDLYKFERYCNCSATSILYFVQYITYLSAQHSVANTFELSNLLPGFVTLHIYPPSKTIYSTVRIGYC